MKPFLLQVAEKVVENHANNLNEVCIVLPNRRAGLFLKKHISALVKKPIWSPDLYSVEDFFFHLSGYNPSNPVNLLFDLYEVHKMLNPENFQTLDEFITWAPTLLADFNDIDFHLADARALYHYLNEAKAIEKWNLGRRSLTDFERNYLRFYQSMFGYYEGIRKICDNKKEAYQGMVYRLLAENQGIIREKSKWKHVYFAGFNALTPAEKKIIQYFEEAGIGCTLWDTDEYYFSDEKQEAGFFLRKQLDGQTRQNISWIGTTMKAIPKNIFIAGTPKKNGQARLAASILNRWINEGIDLRNSAIVLADESLLMTMLNAMPANVGKFNVTMGYPLKLTALYQFFKSLFRMYENIERLSRMNPDRPKSFYFQDVIKIIQHPVIDNFVDAGKFAESLSGSNKVFYFPDEIQSLIKEFSKPGSQLPNELFSNTTIDCHRMLQLTSKLIAALRQSFIEGKTKHSTQLWDAEIEYLYQFSLIIQKLETLFVNDNSSPIKTLRLFFNTLVNSTRIPFYGEPLQGLQILGLLETRNLDFDRIILLSANEGIIPATRSGNSFIPYDILKTFGLPTIQENNAVFAYHFYRLLQRATEIHLVYDTEGTDLGGGEKSRFIYQIIQELRQHSPETSIHEIIESPPPPEKQPSRSVSIKKNEEVYRALLKKAETGFAPTSLNHFRECPLQFYLADIAGIQETEEVEEILEYRTIGIIVHEVLENLYKDFIGKKVTASDIAAMHDRIDANLELSFATNYKKGETAFGKNRLIIEVIRNFIRSFLAHEKQWLSEGEPAPTLEIVELERKFAFTAHFFGLPPVKFKGVIDRVDRLNGNLRITDYKTGLVDSSKELVFKTWDDFLEKKHTGKAFQLLMYAWLYNQEKLNQEETCESGIFSLRTISAGLQCFGFKASSREPLSKTIDEEMLIRFEKLLFETITSLFDREKDFVQTDDTEICKNCIYKGVCNR